MSRRIRLVLVIGLLSLVVAGGLWVWLRFEARQAVDRATSSASEEIRAARLRAGRSADRRWVRQARDDGRRRVIAAISRGIVHASLANWQRDPAAALRARLIHLVDAGESEAAAAVRALFQPSEDDAEAGAALVRLQIQLHELSEAREAAWAGAERFANQRQRFIGLWYDSYTADPTFWQPWAEVIEAGPELARIRTFDVATSVLLRFYVGSDITGLLKPMQTNPFTSYRGEIAAYRLCPLIHCHFSVPHNTEARIEQRVLQELMGFEDVESLRDIRRNDSTLVWFQDQQGTSWLYGTLKEWVPGFVQFPIEQIDGWRHLVDGSTTPARLQNMTLREALADLAEADPDWWEAFERRASGVTPFELAHQLSNLHVFDMLINNWDRYSSAYPGTNCQWNHGQFVSIDNGASFHTPDEWRGHDVQLRIRRIRVFSRRTIQAIRWMDTERMVHILFPDNPFIEGERERYRFFLERRQELLDYVDELVERRGEEAVLVFP